MIVNLSWEMWSSQLKSGKGSKKNDKMKEMFPHLPSNLRSLTKRCRKNPLNKFLDKIFQGRIQIRQKHTIANSIAYLRQIHAWKNFFPWKERKKLNSYVKQNQFRFFCSYYSFLCSKNKKLSLKRLYQQQKTLLTDSTRVS